MSYQMAYGLSFNHTIFTYLADTEQLEKSHDFTTIYQFLMIYF